jgi:hypothetical protein
VDALVNRLPGEATQVAAFDLAAARRQLGLAADLDPADRRIDQSPERRRFEDAALKPMGYLIHPTAAIRAIDHGRATAVVGARPALGDELVIVATRQPRAQIERGLKRAGARPIGAGAYALKPAAGGLDELKVLVFGDGFLVMAGSLDVAAGVVARSTPDPRLKPMRALLHGVRGAFRVAEIGRESLGAPCVRAVAGGERFETHGDEDLLLRLDEPAVRSRVVLNKGAQLQDILTADYKVRAIAIGDRELRIKLDLAAGAIDNSSAAAIAYGEVERAQIYRCKGAAAQPVSPSSSSGPDPLPPPPPLAELRGTALERSISLYVSAGSLAPNVIRVHCPAGASRSQGDVRCTGTRTHPGGVYHYKIVAHFVGGHFKSVDIDSPDDKTKTIV